MAAGRPVVVNVQAQFEVECPVGACRQRFAVEWTRVATPGIRRAAVECGACGSTYTVAWELSPVDVSPGPPPYREGKPLHHEPGRPFPPPQTPQDAPLDSQAPNPEGGALEPAWRDVGRPANERPNLPVVGVPLVRGLPRPGRAR